MKISMIDSATNQIVTFDDLRGDLSGGRKSFNFAGVGFGGLLKMSIRRLTAKDAVDADFLLLSDLEAWVGKDVRVLPYFEKISQLYSYVIDGWDVDVCLEVDGMDLLMGRISLPPDDPKISATHAILEYTRRARVVAKAFEQGIQFRIASTAAEHVKLAEIVDIIEGRYDIQKVGSGSRIECTLTVPDGDQQAELLVNRTDPQIIVIEQPADGLLFVFDQPVALPPLKTTLVGVVPKILEILAQEGGKRSIRVEWIPVDGFSVTRRFLSGTSAQALASPTVST